MRALPAAAAPLAFACLWGLATLALPAGAFAQTTQSPTTGGAHDASASDLSRFAGARVAGRLFAAPFDRSPRPAVPPGMIDGLFALLNHDDQTEQLAAMDGLGLLREVSAVASITGMLRFRSGDGARAWCALDRAADSASHPLGSIVTALLTQGVSPEEVDRCWSQDRRLA